jgi:hypothetical protein
MQPSAAPTIWSPPLFGARTITAASEVCTGAGWQSPSLRSPSALELGAAGCSGGCKRRGHPPQWVIRERIRAIGSTREIGYARPNPPGEKPELPSTAGAATQP